MQKYNVICIKEPKNTEHLIHEAAHIYHKKIGSELTERWLKIGYRERKKPDRFGTRQVMHKNAFVSGYASFDYNIDCIDSEEFIKKDYTRIEFKRYGIAWGFDKNYPEDKDQISLFIYERIKELPEKFGNEIKRIFINNQFEQSYVKFKKMEKGYMKVCEDIAESTGKIYALNHLIDNPSLELYDIVNKKEFLSNIRNKIEHPAIKEKIKLLLEYNFIREEHLNILNPKFLEEKVKKATSNLISSYYDWKKSQNIRGIEKYRNEMESNSFLSCENF